MKMQDEVVKLRAELRRRDGGRGKRFEPELRERVIAYAKHRRGEGASWMAIATELGATFETIRRWCVYGRKKEALRLRAVEVVADPVVVTRKLLSVVSPTGSASRGSCSTKSSRCSRRSDDPWNEPLGTRLRVPRACRSSQWLRWALRPREAGTRSRSSLSGDLFLFVNARRKGCKVLVWDGTGLCIFQKRLERSRFATLWRDDKEIVTLTSSERALFIEGCELVGRRALSPAALTPQPLGVGSRRDAGDDRQSRDRP